MYRVRCIRSAASRWARHPAGLGGILPMSQPPTHLSREQSEQTLLRQQRSSVEAAGEIVVTDDLDALLAVLPPRVREALRMRPLTNLLEIVLDLGRLPEVRYPDGAFDLTDEPVTIEDLAHTMARVGEFGEDNRAGIGGTLH